MVGLVSVTTALEHVHRADEAGDEARVRELVDFGRLADLAISPWFITPMRVARSSPLPGRG